MSKLSIYFAVGIILIAGVLTWQLELRPEAPLQESGNPDLVTGDSVEDLTSSTWVWEETIMNNGDITTPAEEDAFTLNFTTDGSISGTTDCNSFGGSYSLSETEINFGDMAMTRMYCEGSQEQDFVDMVTESNMIYFDENDDLVLLLPYDSGSVIFSVVQTEE